VRSNREIFVVKKYKRYRRLMFTRSNILMLALLLINFLLYSAEIPLNNIANARLISAVGSRDLEGVRQALASGASIYAQDEYGEQVMHLAVRQQEPLPLLELLFEHGANVNAADIEDASLTPLYWALYREDISVVEWLLNHGARVNSDHLNCAQGKKELLGLLDKFRLISNLELIEKFKPGLFGMAIANGDLQEAEVLISQVQIDIQEKRIGLVFAVLHSCNEEAIKLILNHFGEDLQITISEIFIQAAAIDNSVALRLLQNTTTIPVEVLARALLIAAVHGNLEAVKAILENDIQVVSQLDVENLQRYIESLLKDGSLREEDKAAYKGIEAALLHGVCVVLRNELNKLNNTSPYVRGLHDGGQDNYAFQNFMWAARW